MGTGIAIVSAFVAQTPVLIIDRDQAALDKCKEFVESWSKKQLEKKKVTADLVEKAQGMMSYATWGDERLKQVDFLIEAVSENETIKEKVLRQACAEVKDGSVIASNTSSISITKIASWTPQPDRVIGMHFMNPVPVMPLVEIIRGDATSDATLAETVALSEKMGKTTAECKLDRPGFIANRLLMPYINEAAFAVHENIATVDDIDKVMKLGTNVPMGPLTLADFIGLDTCLSIMQVLHKGFNDDKYMPCPLLAEYVDKGWLGKKSGQGFYKY